MCDKKTRVVAIIEQLIMDITIPLLNFMDYIWFGKYIWCPLQLENLHDSLKTYLYGHRHTKRLLQRIY